MVQVKPVDLAGLIATKRARIVVVGLGHVGLPEAIAFAKAGFEVVGFDVDEAKVTAINQGVSHLVDVTNDEVLDAVSKGRLWAQRTPVTLASADVVIIAVPTLLTRHKNPDVSAVRQVARELVRHVNGPTLVILESTGYPGATEEVLKTVFERAHLVADEDFFLACSPSRVDPGNEAWPVTTIPKVVAGLTAKSIELAASLYRQVVQSVVIASSLKAAEMTKLLENSFRTVNIAFANQMGMICHEMGLNVWEIIDLAATKPFGYVPFYPGPGPGGTCIPVDPFYVAWKVREYEFRARFIELAGEVMDEMPGFFIRRLYDLLNDLGKSLKDAKILLLGVAYKKDLGDAAGSPAHTILRLLIQRGAQVAYHDPHVPEFHTAGRLLYSTALTAKLLQTQDAVIILTDHSDVDYKLVARSSRLVLDTRNALAKYPGLHIHQ